jgi:hypothetical protein
MKNVKKETQKLVSESRRLIEEQRRNVAQMRKDNDQMVRDAKEQRSRINLQIEANHRTINRVNKFIAHTSEVLEKMKREKKKWNTE